MLANARDSSVSSMRETTSSADGRYEVRDLKAGQYTITLGGRSVVSYIDDRGLTVDWGVGIAEVEPIAVARLGTAHDESGSVIAVAPSGPPPANVQPLRGCENKDSEGCDQAVSR